MWSHCLPLCLDDDGIERADSQRWDGSSSSLEIDVHEELYKRKDNVYLCWYSGSEDVEEVDAAIHLFNCRIRIIGGE